MRRSLGILIWLFFLPICYGSIFVTKVPNSDTIKYGEILTVTISIYNNFSSQKKAEVMEVISDAEPVFPKKFNEIKLNNSSIIYAVIPPFYQWNITLSPKKYYNITYKIRPTIIGTFFIGPTEVYTDEGTFYSNSLTITVLGKNNGICEPEKGENYLTNPEDCPSGSKDGICDLVKDGICDPDCEDGADVDCVLENKSNLNQTTEGNKKEKSWNLIYYFLFFIVLIILIYFLLKYRKHEGNFT